MNWWYALALLLWTVVVFGAGFVSGGHNKEVAERYARQWKEDSDKWEAKARLFFEALSEEAKKRLGK